jgi:hypothetical protein
MSLSTGVWAVVFPVMFGCRLFGMLTSVEQTRTKLLAERQAALEAGDATVYVEKPPQPDLVMMGLLFGILSLFSVAFLFGPAAIVTGVLGCARGHWKALIGAALGVLGLAVWGWLAFYLEII